MPRRSRRRSPVTTLAALALALAGGGCATPEGPATRAIDAPGSWRQRHLLADRLRRSGKCDEAITAYAALLSESAPTRGLEAQLRQDLSTAYWERAGRIGGQEATAETLQADQTSAIQYANEALTMLEALGRDGPPGLHGRTGRSVARRLRALGRTDEAVEVCRRLVAQTPEDGVDRVRTLHELGNALLDRGGREDLVAALESLSEGLELADGLDDRPPILAGLISDSMGLVYSAQSRFDEAADSFAEAEPICREHGTPDQHSQVLAHLVLALVEAGRFDKVPAKCQQLRSLPAAVTDPRTMAVLGVAALKLGDFAEARQQFDLARHLALQDPGCRDDPSFRVQLATNAAACAQAVGAYDEAERFLLETQRDLEAGGVDPRTAAVIRANLGRMYLTLERLGDAEEQLGAVLAVLRDLQGEAHPDTLRLELDLANLARLRGHLAEAQQRCEAALEGLVAARGEGDPLVAQARLELASLHREQGRCSEALDQAGRALAALDAGLGPNHKQSVTACLQAALIAAECRETPEGAELFARLRSDAGKRFASLKATLGPTNVEVLRVMVYFAEVTAQTPAARTQALERYREAEDGFLELYGDGVPSVAALRLKQGKLLEQMGQADQALRTYDRALRLLDRNLERHPIRAELLTAMGDLYRDKGQQEVAKRLWQDAFRILRATYGPDHPRVEQFRKERAD